MTAKSNLSSVLETWHFKDEEPLRAELFSAEHLNSYAKQLADELKVVEERTNPAFIQRFRDNARTIISVHQVVAEEIRKGEPLTPDVEWLLDNFYVIEEQLREITDDLPRGYLNELPKLSSGEPRVYRIAVELIVHTDSYLDQHALETYVHSLQTVTPLTIGECWALPIMLRLGLVENLRRLADQMTLSRKYRTSAREIIDLWQAGDKLPPAFGRSREGEQLAVHISTQLAKVSTENAATSATLEKNLQKLFPTLQEKIREEHRRQAANQITIGNIITSMRLISSLDWVSFFEQTNVAEQILRRDPATIYPEMDFESRDRYRHVIEQLAKNSQHSDVEVAELVISKTQSISGTDAISGLRKHVGYWLVDDGRADLEKNIGFRAPIRLKFLRAIRRNNYLVYIGGIIFFSLICASSLGFGVWTASHSVAVAMVFFLLGTLSFSELGLSLNNTLITHFFTPSLLPKLDFRNGVPEQYRTILVVPTLIGSQRDIDALVDRLEMHYITSADNNILFALLTDFADADQETLPADNALLQYLTEKIQGLNRRYNIHDCSPFYAFHRRRQWNPAQNKWMGWERKRGKLDEFNQLLRGSKRTSFHVQIGNLDLLFDQGTYSTIPFVITLDSDSHIPLGAARKLIGTLAHPLNRPIYDKSRSNIQHGYTILQPRISVKLEDGSRSNYARFFSNGRGLDPYVSAASDVYQDLFGEGTFTGKGIYDVDAFEYSIGKAFGENRILSHDLIEGCHGRAALVSDIELVDGFPTQFNADIRRQHRWIRGDWQLLPWLLFRNVASATGKASNRLSLISKWKIADNLRRSFVPFCMTAMLIAGWFLLGPLNTVIGLTVLLTVGFSTFHGVLSSIARFRSAESWELYKRSTNEDLIKSAGQTVFSIATLPYKAYVSLDAIVRTLYRLTISRKNLLEWETAAAVEKRISTNRWASFIHMWFLPFGVALIAILLPRESRIYAAPWLVLWFFAPLIDHFASKPLKSTKAELSQEDVDWLRQLCRKTWAYFESCIDTESNWLPPDNLQEYPQEKIAHRISPTNEGFFLVSALIARDFGFLGLDGFLSLIERNLKTWNNLPKYHGHFLNWYETNTLRALTPRYISTVDSGNLAACLLVLHQGLEEKVRSPIFTEKLWTGLSDTLVIMRDACRAQLKQESDTASQLKWNELIKYLDDWKQELPSAPRKISDWPSALAQQQKINSELLELYQTFARVPLLRDKHFISTLESVTRWITDINTDLELFAPWSELITQINGQIEQISTLERSGSENKKCWTSLLDKLNSFNTLELIGGIDKATSAELLKLKSVAKSRSDRSHVALSNLLDELSISLEKSASAASDARKRFSIIATEAEQSAMKMDFKFLFDAQRRLFAIGYNLEDGRLDRSHYDMLCSEARLSSHFAIAKGDVPPKHWFQLGRQMTYTAGAPGLLSWGGTMFEFLMPLLFQRNFKGSLISQACQTAVARQKEYGKQNDVPWGISESAFSALAVNMDYHYQSFGVPGLGLKRGLSEDMVIAPYATALALMVDPKSVIENMHDLVHHGALGRWGFYEAVDFTRKRLPIDIPSIPVRCYMSHHQGMSIIAIANVVNDQRVVKLFHSHPIIRATELLLQERLPSDAPVVQPHTAESQEVPIARNEEVIVSRRLVGFETPNPRTHLLSNGTYSVMVTNTGGGHSKWKDVSVTRWRPDPTRDDWGQGIYIRDFDTGRIWSAAYQPTRTRPDYYEVIYSIDKCEFKRRDGQIETRCEVTVCPESSMELRLVKITNNGRKDAVLEITSYAEVVLTGYAADLSHPAFHKLFLETEFLQEEASLLAKRRPRDSKQNSLWAVHTLACPEIDRCDVQFESSRQNFIGRGRNRHNPQALEPGAKLSGATGFVLDPIFSLRSKVVVPADGSMTLAFSTGVAETREDAMRLADQFHELRNVQRSFELSWAYNQVKLQHLQLSASRSQQCQQLANCLIYPQKNARAPEDVISINDQGVNGLWRHGISGDRPILVVRVEESEHLPFVRELLIAQKYWYSLGLHADIVIMNTHPGSYLDELQEQLQQMVIDCQINEASRSAFVLRNSHLDRRDINLIECSAHVLLDARRGWAGVPLTPLSTNAADPANASIAAVNASLSPSKPKLALERSQQIASFHPENPTRAFISTWEDNSTHLEQLEYWNGIGGFAHDGREYRICGAENSPSPMPWSNVIANSRFGTLVTESGGGYTWAENSRENKLTSWSNDPIVDEPGEILLIRDEISRDSWLPLSAQHDRMTERWVHHGQGYTRFVNKSKNLSQDILISIAENDPVKFVSVKIRNDAAVSRHISVCYYADLVLGVNREQTMMQIVTEVDTESGILTARNAFQQEYPDQRAFLYSIGPRQSFTADRAEFFGRNGDPSALPATTGKPLFGRVGAGLDPCLAQQCRLEIDPGSTVEIAFVLGCGRDIAETRELAKRYASTQEIRSEIERTMSSWDKLLNTIQVKTPNRAFDLLVNRWLLYQILSCRIWGRSGYYQSGGAYGFRDQLQDVMAFVYAKPTIVREHILRCAARQYVQGDVQHWWHPPTGRGTRTKFSDDLLWMPFVVCHYIRVTGDTAILDVVVPFLDSPLLSDEEEERYETPTISSEQASLYEHCCRAIDHAFKLGERGLPLMGCGDWNDGMNKVGAHGKGESVWVGWFLVVLLEQFIPLMKSKGDDHKSNEYRGKADALKNSIETNAWDGEWYRRAFFDDGKPLGSKQNDECQIDSIVQTWAIMANANSDRTDQALDKVFERLVNLRSRIVMLFTPPFDKTELDPGYIKGYLPGVRENGGQYTHPVLWLIHALTLKNDGNRAMEIFDLINPILHTSDKNVDRYQVEPYVIPADVYSIAPHEGRGGWTWYTGSASWAYRVAIESILGLKMINGKIEFKPCAPRHWNKFEVTMNLNGEESEYVFENDREGRVSDGVYHSLTNGSVVKKTHPSDHRDGQYTQSHRDFT